jgi:glycosyltransferase involved in cell wall biosynthesis
MINNKISIVIPTKNEEENIKSLLDSLKSQIDFFEEIIIADANSTDKTLETIKPFSDIFFNKLKIIEGGLPAIARNKAAKLTKGNYILFIDADIILSENILKNSLDKISKKDVHLLTCNFVCNSSPLSKVLYFLNNILIKISKLEKPFAIGGFFLIKKSVFDNLGGFNEELMHCEDYFLSKQVNRKNFFILKDKVYTKDRRIKKMGLFNMIKYMIKNIKERNNIKYFKNDIGYWK